MNNTPSAPVLPADAIINSHGLRLADKHVWFHRDEVTAMVNAALEASRGDAFNAAYEAGWCSASEWADRLDMAADIDSPAYIKNREICRRFRLATNTKDAS